MTCECTPPLHYCTELVLQVELQKKLAESGGESVTLSQQENMQIKGQSARHLVMQVSVHLYNTVHLYSASTDTSSCRS